jgi:hypothetical protein
MEENRIPERVFYMNFESRTPRGRQRNSWQDELREDSAYANGMNELINE